MTVDDLLRQIMTPARRRAVKSVAGKGGLVTGLALSLIHISEPTRL